MPRKYKRKGYKALKNNTSIWNNTLAPILVLIVLFVLAPPVAVIFWKEEVVQFLVFIDTWALAPILGVTIFCYIIPGTTGFKVHSTPRGDIRVRDPHGKFTLRLWGLVIILIAILLYFLFNQLISTFLNDLYNNLSAEYLMLITYTHFIPLLLIIMLKKPKNLGIPIP
jgi:Na+-driven multidrug efflux pump